MSLCFAPARRCRAAATAAIITVTLSVVACSSSASAGPGSGSKGSAGQGSGSSAPTAVVDPTYTGPDAKYFTPLPTPKVEAGAKFTVGYLNISEGNSVLLAMQNAAKAETEALGGRFIALDAQLNQQLQASEMQQLIAQHVSAIVAYPIVPGALAPEIAEAKKAGIPYISLGNPADVTKPPTAGAATTINQAFDYEAYETMKALAQQHPGQQFAEMGLAVPVESLVFLTSRIQYWGIHFGLKFDGQVDSQSDTPAGMAPAATTILTKYPDAKIIVGYQDQSVLAEITAAQTLGRTSIAFATPNSGQKIAQAPLLAGSLEVVYRTPWEEMGKQSAIAAYDAAVNHLTLPAYVNVVSYLVTKANAGRVPWTG